MTSALARKDTGDDLDALWPSDDERARLEAILGPYYQATLEAMNRIIARTLRRRITPGTMVVTDAAVTRILAEAATQVVRIDETTRTALRAQLQLGAQRGYSTWQVAHGVPADGYRGIDGLFQETWRGRAETVARTELQHASVVAARDRFVASGVVSEVTIIDGDDDQPCASRNGTVVLLEQAPGLAHPNCLVGGQIVWAPNRQAGSARWFDGEVIIIRTAADDLLTVTPNHPILTSTGWQPAGDLREGDCVVRCVDPERMSVLVDPDHQHRPALIEQVAQAAGPTSHRSAAAVPLSAEAFHGEAADGDICVIWADRSTEVGARNVRSEPSIGRADVAFQALAPQCLEAQVIPRFDGPANSGVGRAGIRESLRGRHARIADTDGLAHRTGQAITSQPLSDGSRVHGEPRRDLDDAELLVDVQRLQFRATGIAAPRGGESRATEVAMQRRRADTDAAGDLLERLSGLMARVEIVKVERRDFAGHVYNLQTEQGWYIASNLISHNCTLVLVPHVRDDLA